ncbi:MAG: 23S rRNA (guanosine(2251)-2'-O)-methyltransferase RlmB [Leptospiraceae bacterium]|nr:23S rRNA (guanosine(2251)-2'-O)-methyltransferase RlmB [Leptospiraceae bacterium]
MEKKINYRPIFGKRNVEEFLRKWNDKPEEFQKTEFKEILIKKNPSKDIMDIIKKIPKGVKISYTSLGDMDAMFKGLNHQGIALIKIQQNSKNSVYSEINELYLEIESGKKTLILALDRISDTGNLGNILRTAECFGVTHIILPERDTAPVNEVVERISSGATHHLKLYRVTNLYSTLEILKEKGYWIVSTSDKGTEDWDNLPEKEEIVLVMGSEGEGVKKLVLERSDFLVRIPLHGKISSLNVTIACGICLDRIVNR